MIRPVKLSDAEQICDIYNYYVINTIITFEEEAVNTVDMEGRISEITAKYPWIVHELDGRLLGYAYASAWKSRCAYRNSVESTVYLHHESGGHGLGSQLYAKLMEELERLHIHAVIGGVAIPNEASIALHKKTGFEQVAHFREVGFKFNKWIDVTYWERILSNNHEP
jgi:L-amino acid N-acyltransferase YncA